MEQQYAGIDLGCLTLLEGRVIDNNIDRYEALL
jgi:hypothetical protein